MTTQPDTIYESRRIRWESRTSLPLTVASLIYLVAYAWPILDPSVRDRPVFDIVIGAAWALFLVDYVARLYLSRRRAAFMRGNIVDLGAVVLPMLRPLRLLRLVTVLAVLNRHAGSSLRGRVAVYVVGSSILVLFVASLAMLDAERGADGATITSFGDALWWALTTVTTVGYGDHFPVTPQGRLIAAGLMVAGIALIGVVTASFASWLIERVAEVEEEASAATQRDMQALTAEVAELRALLIARESQGPPS
ncbi:potassium channel protein [Nocardioides guangzhouensis]|uniref:Potassium channel protein n=1 Tax=Nocardioides guangzhouensis TaxID=2497878 RepID=A0A4Q4ZBU6_9ACTN|nr:potassium channel family protein [Nocardioides guangzhouensis]RYP84614.1 potassium channel protein [Nocardioides guangzhouensis]